MKEMDLPVVNPNMPIYIYTVELPKTGLSENRTFSFGSEYSPIYLSKMVL